MVCQGGRMRLRRVAAVLLAMALFAACGGDESGDAGTPEPAANIDGDAVQQAMPDFVAEVAEDYGQISPPIWVSADEALLGYVPDGVDPVEFCNRLSEFLQGASFTGVPLTMVGGDQTEALATGVSGSDCSAP